LDNAITHWINAAAGNSAFLDAAMRFVTQFGVPVIVLAVAAQWWPGTRRDRVRHAVVAAGLSFLLGLAINQVILLFVHRVRPYDAGVTQLLIDPSADWSFPSDHATAAIAVVAAFALHGLHRRALALLVLALIVCWSRIYIGTHYLTDILGGALTGLAAAIAVKLAYRPGTKLDRLITGIF
jgi:undecaprenyl-diphosphatase